MNIYKIKQALIVVTMLFFFVSSFVFKDVIISELLAFVALISSTILFHQLYKQTLKNIKNGKSNI